MIGLALYNASHPGFDAALNYLLKPDFSKIDAATGLAAVGQAFFSIGVAMAGMWIYGAYLPKQQSIFRISLLVVIADTLVALLAGLVIFPLVFRFDLDPAGGVGLIFQVLPVAFGQMPGGVLIATAFFTLLALAAISSIVGFIEPLVVARTANKREKRGRRHTMVGGTAAFFHYEHLLVRRVAACGSSAE